MLGKHLSVRLSVVFLPSLCLLHLGGAEMLSTPLLSITGGRHVPSLGRENGTGPSVAALAWHSPHALAPFC